MHRLCRNNRCKSPGFRRLVRRFTQQVCRNRHAGDSRSFLVSHTDSAVLHLPASASARRRASCLRTGNRLPLRLLPHLQPYLHTERRKVVHQAFQYCRNWRAMPTYTTRQASGRHPDRLIQPGWSACQPADRHPCLPPPADRRRAALPAEILPSDALFDWHSPCRDERHPHEDGRHRQ